MNIEKILDQPESKTLEFKQDLSSPLPVLKTIIAFANTAGGTLVIGKTSEGEIIGVPDVLAAEEKITNLIADNICPLILPEIEVVTVQEKNLLIVKIARWYGPFYLKKEGKEKGVYLRLGSTNRLAEGHLLADLQRDLANIIFDQTPRPDVGENQLDLKYAKKCFSRIEKKVNETTLKTLRILVPYQNRYVPSVGGVILFGNDEIRENLFPNTVISCARFRGMTKTQFIDQEEIKGGLIEAVSEIPKFIRKNTRLASIIKGMKREDIPEYPETAIREVLINALVHTDYSIIERRIQVAIYSDRLEIINPGMLPLGYTLEDFKKGTSHVRNRTIVRVFKELGEMEEWGSGYRRITEECEENGYPIPIWEEQTHSICVTFFPHPATSLEEDLSLGEEVQVYGVQSDLLLLFKKRSFWKFKELHAEFAGKISERSLRYELSKLKKEGKIKTEGKGPATVFMLSGK